jgi:hypothetical protein
MSLPIVNKNKITCKWEDEQHIIQTISVSDDDDLINLR